MPIKRRPVTEKTESESLKMVWFMLTSPSPAHVRQLESSRVLCDVLWANFMQTPTGQFSCLILAFCSKCSSLTLTIIKRKPMTGSVLWTLVLSAWNEVWICSERSEIEATAHIIRYFHSLGASDVERRYLPLLFATFEAHRNWKWVNWSAYCSTTSH
jgi:hypothetical protein